MGAQRVQWIAGGTALVAAVLLVLGIAVSAVSSAGSWSPDRPGRVPTAS